MELEKDSASPPRNSLWPLALLGTAVALLSLRKPPAQSDKKNYQAIPPNDTTKPEGNTAPQQVGFVPNAIPSPQQTYYPHGGKKRTPGWEKAAVVVALGILFVNAWQSWETRKSAGAAKQSAEAAIAAQRPWLKLELRMAQPLTIIPAGYDFAVIPSVTNIGNSVAKNVSLRFDHRVSGMSPNDDLFKVAATYRDWCENLKPNVAGLDTYFPHETGESPGAHVNVLMDEMQKYRLPPKNEPRFILLFFGCLAYKFDGSPSLHHTAVVYELSARQNNLPYLLKINTPYAMNDLIFEHFPWDWEHAD